MSLSEPPLGGLEPTPIRQGGPPARAVIGVFVVGLIAVVGIGVFGQSATPPTPDRTATPSIAAVSSPTPVAPPTPTPAPTLRTGGCQTGLAPITEPIPRHPRPLQPPPLVSVAAGGGMASQVIASGDAFWALGPGSLSRWDPTGRMTGQWDYLDDTTFGSYSISPARGGGVWLMGLGDIRWFDGETFADVIPSPTSSGDLSSLVEAPDGAVWATTYQKSPQRWNGVAWEALCDDRGTAGDGSSRIAISPDGSVWVIGGGDLVHFDSTGGTLGSVPIPQYGRDQPNAMTVSADGSVWVASSSLVQRFDGQWTNMSGADSRSFGAGSLTAADDGSVWAVTGSADGSCCSNVARFAGTDTQIFTSTDGLGDAGRDIGIGSVAVRGADVVATTGLGTYRIPAAGSDSQAWSAFGPAPTTLPDPSSVALIVADGKDKVVAAAWDRLWEVRGGDWIAADPPGLAPGSSTVVGLDRSRDGAVVVATSAGAFVRTDGRWATLERQATIAVAFDSSGACWVAPGGSDPNTGDTLKEHALYRFTREAGRWVRSVVAVPADVTSIEAVAIGPDGDVWLRGMRSDIASLWRRHGKRWTLVPPLPGPDASWSGRRMAVTPGGDVVMAAGGSGSDQSVLAYRFDGTAWSSIRAIDDAASYGSNDVAAAADGTTWVSAWGSGLTAIGGPNGDLRLPGASVSVALDADGTVYVVGPSGIYRVRR